MYSIFCQNRLHQTQSVVANLSILCSTKTAVNATAFLKVVRFLCAYCCYFFIFDFTTRRKNSLTKHDRQYTYNVTMGRVLATIVVVERDKYYILCVFVALSTQHATRMRHNIICSMAFYTIFFHIISSTT
jgi:hypothetical protein